MILGILAHDRLILWPPKVPLWSDEACGGPVGWLGPLSDLIDGVTSWRVSNRGRSGIVNFCVHFFGQIP